MFLEAVKSNRMPYSNRGTVAVEMALLLPFLCIFLLGILELSVLIHEYDRGPSRKMFSLYNDLDSDQCVASAIAKGRIKPEEVAKEVLEAIRPRIDAFGKLQEK